jgi:putative ATP-binding cassette transporter
MSSSEESLPGARPQTLRQMAVRDSDRHQIRALIQALWSGKHRMPILLLALLMAAVICATALGQVRLNAWNQPFYDAVAHKDVASFLDQLVVFGTIVSVLLVLNVAQGWLQQMFKLKLREWLTRDLIAEWLEDKRALRLTRIGDVGANPDQRIHQDGQHLTELSADLAIGLFQSSLLLASFIGVLWILSDGIVLVINGGTYSVPGYMVWCALLYAATGSWLSWRIGRPLVSLNAERYAREAEFRSTLVRTHEHAEGIALSGYEQEESEHLLTNFAAVVEIARRIIQASVRLTWVTSGYGWLALVVPIVVASPGYFGGKLSFGALMAVVGAFYQVQQALRWFVDNAASIADWRATLFRVMSFRNALFALDWSEEGGDRIELGTNPDGRLRLEDLKVMTPAGAAYIAEGDVEVKPGERVLIVGGPGGGKTSLFLAIAGLAALGSGRILLPAAARTAFLSQRPYVPPGSLRDALRLAVPRNETDVARAAALTRVGLGHLTQALDRVERWDAELTIGEQHRIACARLLLSKPDWVISDNALDLLDEEFAESILSIFAQELAGTAVLSLASRESASGFYGRVLNLIGPERPSGSKRLVAEEPPPERSLPRPRDSLPASGGAVIGQPSGGEIQPPGVR